MVRELKKGQKHKVGGKIRQYWWLKGTKMVRERVVLVQICDYETAIRTVTNYEGLTKS